MIQALLIAAAVAFAQDGFKDIDGIMREAETSVLVMESLGTKEKPSCPPGVNLKTAVQDYNEGRLGAEASRWLLSDRNEVLEYYTCRALATNSPQPCADLRRISINVDFQTKDDKKELQRPETYEFLCVSGYTDLAIAKGGISGDKAMVIRACKEHDAAGHRDFRPDQVETACRLLAEKFGNPQAICAAVAPLFRTPVAQKYCVNEMRMAMGDPAACASMTEPDEKRFCAAAVNYKKAFTAKNAAQCGDSVLCRAMMGDGQSCEPIATRAAARLCYVQYNYQFASKEHTAIKVKLDHLNKLLSGIDPAKLPGGAPMVLQLEERIEKVARLQHRADQALARFSPPSLWKAPKE